MNTLLTSDHSALLNQICSYVCQSIITIQEYESELLLEKYKNLQWRDSQYQSKFTEKLTELLSNTQDWDALVQRLQRFLQFLLIPESFNSPILIELLQKIHQLNPKQSKLNVPKDIELVEKQVNVTEPELNDSASLQGVLSEQVSLHGGAMSLQQGIAVLLLDAENIQITTEIEQQLTTVCTYPLQIKIAFANWRKMGGLDVELHQRNYDLIHVPAGRDHADGKMIAVGLSIHERYLKAREVLVCSSDTVMTTLCNHLQQNGLVVYRVQKQEPNITISNNQNGETQILVPSLEQLSYQIKEIIEEEERLTSNQWIRLSKISSQFYIKSNLSINHVVSHYFPGQTAKDFFIINSEFVVHQSPEETEIYIALFRMNQSDQKVENKSDLEKALVRIITASASKTPNSYLSVETIGCQFYKQYGQGIRKILKKLNLNGNFLKFLSSCSCFQVQKIGNSWQVSLRTNLN